MIALLWLACEAAGPCDTSDPQSCDSDETQPWTGTARLDDFGWGCDDGVWWYDVYTVGRTGGATVDVQETAANPLSETQALAEKASDPYGYWDEWYVELVIVPRDGEYTAGSETRFQCEDEPNLTFKVAVVDTNGGDLPCEAYGRDPTLFSECEAAQ